mgnify:CR=1 FL=1
MKYLNSYIYIAIISYILYSWFVYAGYPEARILFYIVGVVNAIALSGIIFIIAGLVRTGSWILFVGSVPLVPLGLLGLLGARNVLDRLSVEEFQQRKENQNV